MATSEEISTPAEQHLIVFVTVQDQNRNPCLLEPKHTVKLEWNINNGEPAITVQNMLDAAFAEQSLRKRLGLEDPAQSIEQFFKSPMVMLNNDQDLTTESVKRGEDENETAQDERMFHDMDEPVVNGGKYSVVLAHKQVFYFIE